MAKPRTSKAKGRRGNTSTQAAGSKPLQPTTDLINQTQVTSRGNSETPGQSGSGDGNDNTGQWNSFQSENASNTWETVTSQWDKGWDTEKTSVDNQAGKIYPLPGTIVDFSRPKSDFFPECQLPPKQKPASYDSLLELARTTLRPNLPNRRLFSYNREWISLGDRNPQDVYNMVHERDLLRQLPRARKEASQGQLWGIKKRYRKANRDNAFRLMQASKHCEPTLLLAPAPTPGVLNTSKPIKAEHGKNPKNKENWLIRLMSIPEIFNKVVDDIEPTVADLTSLAMACKDTARLTSDRFAVWDFSSGNFHTEESYRNGAGGVRMNTLIITPITKVEAASPRDKPFEQEFKLLTKMVRTMCSTLTSFRHLILDQIPYLNVDLVRLMVKSTPNLESIAITRCKQLDITKLDSLLYIIESKRRLAATGRHKKVRLDFHPYFFEGPTSAPNTFGSFGLTYHKPTFDVPKAVFAWILTCWVLADSVGVDLLSDSSGIWHFIRRLPGPDPFWAYKAREAVLTWDRDRKTDSWGFETTSRLWNDLGAAVCGDTTEKIPHEPNRRVCSGCITLLPDYLFADIKNLVCWGCRMGAFVANHEDSHFRDRTNRVVEIWLGNRKQWPIQRLYHLPCDEFEERDALNMARLTDKAWRYELFEFKPGMPRFPQAIHWKTHLSSTKRTRDLLWPLTGPTNNREGGPQYENPYLQAGVHDLSDEQTEKEVRDLDRRNRRDFFGIYAHDIRHLPDLEPYNRNWEARERAKAVWKRKAASYSGGW